MKLVIRDSTLIAVNRKRAADRKPDWTTCAPLSGVRVTPEALAEILRLHAERYYSGGRGANLQGAYLQGAYLRGANLQSADLRGADLRGAYLQGADLQGADLRGADLRGAYLQGADLGGAYLQGADLQGADLRYADLQWTNLQGADLQGAYLPAPSMVLLATWSELPAPLTVEAMRLDAACHPDPTAFDRWAAGGPGPYNGVRVQRACNFTEHPDLWSPGPCPRPYDLMAAILAEKCPPWSAEKIAEFEAQFAAKETT